MPPYFALGICIIMAIAAQILLKMGLTELRGPELGTFQWLVTVARSPLFQLAVVSYCLSAAAWVFALARLDLSLAYPILTLSVVGVSLASAIILGERLTITRLLGTMLTLVGAWFVLRS